MDDPHQLDLFADAYPENPGLPDYGASAWEGNMGDPGVVDDPEFLPHAFAGSFGDGGAKVRYGQLIYEEGGEAAVVVPEFGGVPMKSVDDYMTQLDSYGDVYLYWEIDSPITVCEIRVGTSNPTGDQRELLLFTANEGANLEQKISSDVFFAPDVSTHPFKGRVTGTDEITIGPGRCRCLDLSGPAEMLDILQAETAVGSLTDSGTIWAYVPGTFAQIENKTGTIPDHNHTLAVGNDGEALLTLKTYRWLAENGIASYTTSPPEFGSYWSLGDPHVYVPILDFETVSGQVAITAQRVVDDIFITDSYCTITVSA
jgi:hypothetical protein